MKVPEYKDNPATNVAKSNMQFRERVFYHLKLSQSILDNTKDLRIAYHHFNPVILEQLYAIDSNRQFQKTISLNMGKQIGLTAIEKSKHITDTYIFPPNQTWIEIEEYITVTYSSNSLKKLQSMVEETTNPSNFNLSTPNICNTKQRLEFETLQSSLDSKVEEYEVKMRTECARELQMEKDLTSFIHSFSTPQQHEWYIKSSSTLSTQKVKIEELMQRVYELENVMKGMKIKYEQQLAIQMAKGHRYRYTNDQWHEQNTWFAKFWLGFESWHEFKTFHGCIWPEVDMNVNQMYVEGDDNISEFEKSIIAKMRMRKKGVELEVLSTLWDRHISSISRYCSQWIYKWGFVGQDLSILDLTEELIDEMLPEEFKTNEYKDVVALVDGKEMKLKRKLQIRVLQGKQRDKDSLDSCSLPTRLSKLPGNRTVLADRGFAYDAIRYPNANRHRTPHFITGRKQFSQKELTTDMITCRLRYSSETNFSRITEENILMDVIGYNSFIHATYALHWAHASANLCKEFTH